VKYSIIVVSLNAGDELSRTIESILKQTYNDIEIIVKDGCSTDGSVETLPEDERIKRVVHKDKSIYDGMNQGIDYATGDYILFMNCGDCFYNDKVLEKCSEHINKHAENSTIFYGDCFTKNRNSILRYPDFSDYLCFTMVLCHQATFYPAKLMRDRKFNLEYKMAADYEYYVHAYKHGARLVHIPVTVAVYQGDGASETTNNRRLVLDERRKALKENYNQKEYRKLWIQTQLRGVGIKQLLVRQEWFYPVYKKIAEIHYRKNKLVR